MNACPRCTVNELRELHAPIEHYSELQCDGCDYGGWEGEPPEWPCRTARLVYTDTEITEITTAYALYCKWEHQAVERRHCRSLAPSHFMRAFSLAYKGIESTFIADKVFPIMPPIRNEIVFRREPEWQPPT